MRKIVLFFAITMVLVFLSGCTFTQKTTRDESPEMEIKRVVVCNEKPEGLGQYKKMRGNILPRSNFWIYYEIKGFSVEKDNVNFVAIAQIADENQVYLEDKIIDEIFVVGTLFGNEKSPFNAYINRNGNGWFCVRMWSGGFPNKYTWYLKIIDGFNENFVEYELIFEVSPHTV